VAVEAGVFDVIVIGAGHAGCEAAHAAARLGARTALISPNLNLVAAMSCNPAIGGIAKGHLVREIDALGGLQGTIADRTGIQFRLLNRRRGPAVQSPRTQSDRDRYRHEMKRALESVPDLHLIQGEVVEITVRSDRATGVVLHDERWYQAGAVVLTTGTFLNGIIHIGPRQIPAGRAGEPPSIALADSLRRLGYACERLKTGTPPRIDGRTIDYSRLTAQQGDETPTFLSFQTSTVMLPQTCCHIVHTDDRVHRIIREHIHRSPLYSGQIKGIGPRYCPSIEDKVVKFPDKDRHQLFVEPEGLDTHEIYLNGFSSSMPLDVQISMLHALPGFERAEIIRPAYAIEYDFVQPTELWPTLESRRIGGLFHAGQINGTSGYEEAAAQGLVAGINAARQIGGSEPFVVERSLGYLGILIRDLTDRGVDEPYRMFTSRAELRLLFRIDNADARLTPLGRRLGLVDDVRWEAYSRKYATLDSVADYARTKHVSRAKDPVADLPEHVQQAIGSGRALAQLIKMPEIRFRELAPLLLHDGISASLEILDQVEHDFKYAGYVDLQRNDLKRLEKKLDRRIPADFDYDRVPSLSREMRERLKRTRPDSLLAAEHMRGITPAALSALSVFMDMEAPTAAQDTSGEQV